MSFPLDLTPPVFLAPMAGITDLPYRNLVAGFGAGLVVSEMIASGEWLTKRPGTREKAELGIGLEGTSVQISGREAGPMIEAAKMIEAQGARIIDINMGCPAKKVTQGASGSALMKTPDPALRLIEAVVGAVAVPVTLKTRLDRRRGREGKGVEGGGGGWRQRRGKEGGREGRKGSKEGEVSNERKEWFGLVKLASRVASGMG